MLFSKFFKIERHSESNKILSIILMKRDKYPKKTGIAATSIWIFNIRKLDGSKFAFSFIGPNYKRLVMKNQYIHEEIKKVQGKINNLHKLKKWGKGPEIEIRKQRHLLLVLQNRINKKK